MSWFYCLVKESSGKIRVWEIYKEKDYYWGNRAIFTWMLKEFPMVIKDLLIQKKYLKRLWDGKKLDEGNKKISKKWNKEIKNLNLKELTKK